MPLGLILLPLKMVDSLAEQLWTQFFAHWKMLLAFLIVGGICFILSTIELLYPGQCWLHQVIIRFVVENVILGILEKYAVENKR